MTKRLFKHTIKWTWLSLAMCIILFAILMTLSRVMFVFAGHYKSNIEQLASQFFDHPVQIQRVHASWHGLQPVFKLRNISILSPDKSTVLSEVHQLDIGLNVFDTLIHLLTREFTAMGGYADFKNLTLPSRVGQGVVDGKLWFKIKHQKITKAHAIINAKNIIIKADQLKSPLIINQLKLHVAWKKEIWKGKFEKLDIIYAELPEFQNLNGSFEIAKDHGKLHLFGKNVQVAYKALFNEPFVFKKTLLNLIWEKNEDGWQIYSPSFALMDKFSTASGEFRLDIPHQGSPIINLQARASLNDADQFKHYIPHKITNPDLDHWLSNAFNSGKVSEAQMVLRGPLDKFPFDHNEGVFEINAQFADIDFHYKDEWSDLNKLFGQLLIDGRKMQISAEQGKIVGQPIHWVKAEIPNLAIPDIHVDGSIHMDLADALEFVHQSPLENTVGKELRGLALKGPMSLALKLDIPLHDHLPVSVLGDVEMKNGKLNVPDRNLKTKGLQGSFHFTENDLRAENIMLQLYGQPLKISIKTTHPTDSVFAETQVYLNGKAKISDLLPDYDRLKKVIEGETNYKATLLLHRSDDNKVDTLTFLSDLKGITVNLPAPLGKTKNQNKSLHLNMDLSQEPTSLIKFNYADIISGVSNFQGDMHLRLGEQKGYSNEINEGIKISGELPELNIEQWYDFYKSLNIQSSGKNTLDFLKAVDVNIEKLNFFNQHFNQVGIKLSHQSQGKMISIDSPSAKGELIIPSTLTSDEIIAEFDYLKLSPMTIGEVKNSHPKNAFPINAIVHHLFYDKQAYGELKCSLTPEGSILRINNLSLVSKNINFSATGYWQEFSDHQESRLTGAFHCDSLGNILKQFNFTDNIAGGNGQAKFNLSWSDRLLHPSLATLNGSINLEFHNGQIVKLSRSTQSIVDVGRVLNIFSLQSLPKRLSTGFSDFTHEGFAFDDLKGDFVLESGNAYTQNASIEGTVALVGAVGRVGLANKDYDMKLMITPYVTSSLPIVAALTGGPIAGVATFFAEPLFSKALNDITTKSYSLQGLWENPHIVKLNN